MFEVNVPLKTGSSSSSNRALFLLPSPLPVTRLSSRFSNASLSRPRTDVRGVGGSIGFAGALNACRWKDPLQVLVPEGGTIVNGQTHRVLPHQAALPCGLWRKHLAIVHGDPMHWLRR